MYVFIAYSEGMTKLYLLVSCVIRQQVLCVYVYTYIYSFVADLCVVLYYRDVYVCFAHFLSHYRLIYIDIIITSTFVLNFYFDKNTHIHFLIYLSGGHMPATKVIVLI